MKIIMGLGNPGDKLFGTRHNIGRDIVHAAQKKFELLDFVPNKKLNALTTEGKIGKIPCALVLPETFMNKSGHSVAPALRKFKAKPKELFVIHDDADISLGSAKLSFNKRSAGHKGVESVMRAAKTREFWRFRIGIGSRRDIPAEKLVLKRFSPDEEQLIKKVRNRTLVAIGVALTDGPERAMNDYNAS